MAETINIDLEEPLDAAPERLKANLESSLDILRLVGDVMNVYTTQMGQVAMDTATLYLGKEASDMA